MTLKEPDKIWNNDGNRETIKEIDEYIERLKKERYVKGDD